MRDYFRTFRTVSCYHRCNGEGMSFLEQRYFNVQPVILGKSCLGSMRDRFEFHEILVHRSAIFFEIVEIFFVFLLRIYI